MNSHVTDVIDLARFYLILLTAVFGMGLFMSHAAADSEHNPIPDNAPDSSAAYRSIKPNDRILKFHQLNFKFDFGYLEDSDWGRVAVDADSLKKYSNGCPGFVNIFVRSSVSEEPMRVVADLYIPSTHENGTCSLEDQQKRMIRDDKGDDIPNDKQEAIPYTRRFDLRPDEEGSGPIPEIDVLAIFSPQPMAHQLEQISLVHEAIEWNQYDVSPAPFNAQGGLAYIPGEESLPLPDPNPDNLIDPGPPPPVVAIPMDIGAFTYPTAFFQDGEPNVHAAKSQCVPVAVANALGFLEREYDSEAILKWELAHLRYLRGLGEMHVEGNMLVWEPVPVDSLVANVDTLMRRPFATSFDFGEGTSSCNFIQGTFGYQELFGGQASVEFRHQAGSAVIDPNTLACDPAPFALGSKVSTREGSIVTWEWVYEQLTKGRAVILNIRWYEAGQPNGGHMMRVKGATRVGGRDYLTFVNDSDQGNNYTGLEFWTVEISDVRGPVQTVVPNGIPEIDRGPHEVVFAMSFEAKPTLVIF